MQMNEIFEEEKMVQIKLLKLNNLQFPVDVLAS